MKLLCAIIPLACLPSCQVAAKSSKLQTQSFSSGPSSIDEWVDLGKKQLGLGKAKESAASYRKALKASCTGAQSSTAAYAGMCQALLTLEDWGSAQKACGKSLSYRNAVVDCLSVQEQAQVSLDGFRIASHFGHNLDAEARLREVIALLPENPVGYFNLGIVLLDLQRSEEALPLVETAAKLSLEGGSGDWTLPKSHAAATVSNQIELVALLHLDAGRFQEASKWLKTALNAPGLRDNFMLAHHLRVSERLAWLETATALRVDQCLAIHRDGSKIGNNNNSNTAGAAATAATPATAITSSNNSGNEGTVESLVSEEQTEVAATVVWPSEQELQKYSAKKLRKLISSAGGNHDDCFGKQELLTRVQELRQHARLIRSPLKGGKKGGTITKTAPSPSVENISIGAPASPSTSASAAVVSTDGEVKSAILHGEANHLITPVKVPQFSTEVLRARQRWEKEAAQMLNQYKGFRPPHAGWQPTEIIGRPPTPEEFKTYVRNREPLVVRGGRMQDSEGIDDEKGGRRESTHEERKSLQHGGKGAKSKGKSKGGRRNDNGAVLEALNWRLQDWTSDQLKEVLSNSNLNAKTNAKTTKSSITGSKKKSNKNSSGLGGDGNDVKGGGGQVHVFAAQQPYGEVGLFGGPGQPPAKSQSRPQDSYRMSLEWTAFVETLFHEPSSADSPRRSSAAERSNITTVAQSLAQPDVSMYFAIQPGADQNDKNPYEFPLGASPQLLADIPLPTSLIPEASLTSANMWFGKAARGIPNNDEKGKRKRRNQPSCAEIHTHLHNDPQDNLYVLVRGQKKFTLWAPDSVLNLHPVTPPSRVRSDGFVEWSSVEKRFKGYRFSEVPGLEGYFGPAKPPANNSQSAQYDGSSGSSSPSSSYDQMCATASITRSSTGTGSAGATHGGNGSKKIDGGDSDDTFLAETLPDEGSAEWRAAIGARVAAEELRAEFPQWGHSSVAVEVTLEAGDLLYLPRGWYHEVTTTCGLKVSDVIDDDTDDDDIDLSSEEDPLPSANMHDRVTLAVNHWFDPAIALRES